MAAQRSLVQEGLQLQRWGDWAWGWGRIWEPDAAWRWGTGEKRSNRSFGPSDSCWGCPAPSPPQAMPHSSLGPSGAGIGHCCRVDSLRLCTGSGGGPRAKAATATGPVTSSAESPGEAVVVCGRSDWGRSDWGRGTGGRGGAGGGIGVFFFKLIFPSVQVVGRFRSAKILEQSRVQHLPGSLSHI